MKSWRWLLLAALIFVALVGLEVAQHERENAAKKRSGAELKAGEGAQAQRAAEVRKVPEADEAQEFATEQTGQRQSEVDQMSHASAPAGNGQTEPDHLNQLVRNLTAEDVASRREAAKELAMYGPQASQAVEPLMAILKDPPDSYLQVDAEHALGRIKDPRAVEPLIAVLNDSNVVVRCAAVEALGNIKDPRAVAPLIVMLNDRNQQVRLNVVTALGKIQDPRAVEPLIAALQNLADPYVQAYAADSLGQIKDPRAIEPLTTALKDRTREVRRWAITGLQRMGAPGVEPLIASLKNPNAAAGVHWDAAQALANVKDSRAVSILMEALREHNNEVIAAASFFFIRRAEPDSEDALIAALNEFGDRDMAEYFLACGNPKLAQGAREFTQRKGFTLSGEYVIGKAGWGSER